MVPAPERSQGARLRRQQPLVEGVDCGAPSRGTPLSNPAAAYGEAIARWYDDLYPSGRSISAALARLADGGKALELGIGTGRVALPLAARGIEVHGIDISPAMLAQLRSRPGGHTVLAFEDDFGQIRLAGGYALVFVLEHTFFALPTRQAQQACLHDIHRVLAPGGRFVVEAFVPQDHMDSFRARDGDRALKARRAGQWTVHDPGSQTLRSLHHLATPEGAVDVPVTLRYASPAELDAMAAEAGLVNENRWGDWSRDRFVPQSRSHVSVYRRPA